MQRMKLICLIPGICLLGACDGDSQSKGFSLPKGDAAAGQEVFQVLQCTDCHSVREVEFVASDTKPEMDLQLGGKMRKVYTYGELVTSIINPSHKISRRFPGKDLVENSASKMRNYNDVLTVSELSDLVAFLEAHYELMPYQPTRYPAM